MSICLPDLFASKSDSEASREIADGIAGDDADGDGSDVDDSKLLEGTIYV